MTQRFTTLLAYAALTAPILSAQNPSASQLAFFENEVRPLLAERCFKCHGPKTQKSQMRLDHIQHVLKGGSRGTAIVPGKPEESRMIEAVRYTNIDFQMPPKGRLSAAAIDTLERWIAMGAPWPDEPVPTTVAKKKKFDLWKRKAKHWAWQPRAREQPPTIDDPYWRGNAIDRFIITRLREKGLHPAAPATKTTLLRRVTFDLTGLPPTPAEIDAFRRDGSATSYAKVIDRLLASPGFGERWARHWLDLVRFAETLGHEFDYKIPNAWQYRDYVIRALNSDLPYDQFVREQIAGDLLLKPRRHPTEGFNESIIGTAFWWFPEQSHSPVDVRQSTSDRTDNQIDTFSKTFVGLTVACARCHDHKFDAIPTSDYYALAGFLKSSRYMQRNARPSLDGSALRRLHDAALELRAAWAATLRLAAASVKPYFLTAAYERLGDPRSEKSKLDPEILKRWIDVMKDKQIERDSAHPLHAIALLLKLKKPEDDVQTLWRQSLRRHRDHIVNYQKAGPRVFVDFTKSSYAGWRTEGVAFGNGPIRGQTMVHSDWIPTAVHTGGWAHSNARGLAGQGVLHSREFTIDKPFLHILAHGRESRIKVVLEGFHLNRNPIYGTLKQNVNSTTPRWFSIDLRMWQGKRACLVFCDQETHDLADPKRYRHGSYIAVQRVQFSDVQGPPHPYPAMDRVIFGPKSAPVRDLEAIVDSYSNAITAAANALETGQINSGQARLLNWLWEKKLVGADGHLAVLRRRYLAIKTLAAADMHVPSITDGSGQDEHIYIRGSHKNLGAIAPRRFLTAIAGAKQKPLGPDESGRLVLAERLLAQDNPFTSRVIVNRLWHHLFGQGIVTTVDNFGVLGEKPSHPLLLDWLARKFETDGWSIKTAIRRMVLSRTYRMSSSSDAGRDARDPVLRWRHRMAVRRLTGEAIRDAVLHVSGRLDPKMFGPSVPVHVTRFMTGRGKPKSGPIDGAGRRSIYLSVSRNFLHPFLLAFDFPLPAATMGRRTVTNVPAQALAMLNDPFIKAQAGVWVKRIAATATAPRDRIRAMYRQAYSRAPRTDELSLVLDFLQRQSVAYGCDLRDPRPWQDLSHAMWNVKEFMFLR